MAGTVDHVLRCNEDFDWSVRWKDDAGAGYTLSAAKMTVATEAGVELVTVEVGDGITLEAGGWAHILIPAATLFAIPAEHRGSSHVYDVLVTRDADGRKKVLFAGRASLTAGVTEP